MGKRSQNQKKSFQARNKKTATERITERMKSNPFEKRENFKTKHQVHNRRVKGHTRNMIQARTQAIERRKGTLLVEYENNKKANTFTDRRFGEFNDSLSEEDKMLMRLTAERKKELKKMEKKQRQNLFALSDDTDGLTHGGMAIGDDYEGKDDIASSDDDDDRGVMDDSVLKNYMFGGGTSAARPGDGLDGDEDDPTRHKSKREVMEEIIAKSKLLKAEKKKNKAQQEDQIERLDSEFQDIAAMLQFRPKKGDPDEPPKPKLDAYDVMSRELAFEARAKASERQKSDEEKAMEEKARLENLEKQRLKRMRGWASEEEEEEDGDDDADTEDDGEKEELDEHAHLIGNLDGRKTKKRKVEAKRITDDDLGGDINAVGKKRSKGEFLGPASDDDEEESNEDDDDDDEDDEEENDEKYSGLKEDSDDDEMKELKAMRSDEDEDDDEGEGDEDEDEEEEEEEEDAKSKMKSKNKKSKKGADDTSAVDNTDGDQNQAQANMHIPFVFECPTTGAEYRALLRSYARSPRDETVIIDRICKCHSVKLGGAGVSKAQNRKKLGSLVGVLLKRVEELGSKGSAGVKKYAAMLDWLTGRLFKLAWEVPVEAGVAFNDALKRMQRQLRRGLAETSQEQAEQESRAEAEAQAQGQHGDENDENDENENGPAEDIATASCLPSGGQVLLLRLVSHIFPVTDKAHVVVTPARLLVGQILSHSSVVKYNSEVTGAAAAAAATVAVTSLVARGHIRDVVSALLCGSAMLDLVGDGNTGKMTPEVVNLLVAVVLHCALPHASAEQRKSKGKEEEEEEEEVYGKRSPGGVFLPEAACEHPQLGWVCTSAANWKSGEGGHLPPLQLSWLSKSFSKNANAKAKAKQQETQSEVATAVLAAVCNLTERALARHTKGVHNIKGIELGGVSCPALPELFGPLLRALEILVAIGGGANQQEGKGKGKKSKKKKAKKGKTTDAISGAPLPSVLLQRLQAIVLLLQNQITKAVESRDPLRLQSFQAVALESLAPRFEETYTYKKDLDPDRQRAELRQLKKEVKREHKGAVREIKRDSAFLAGVKWKQDEEANDERKRVWHENAVWQDQQEANFRQQEKQGGGLMKDKPVVKRSKSMKRPGVN